MDKDVSISTPVIGTFFTFFTSTREDNEESMTTNDLLIHLEYRLELDQIEIDPILGKMYPKCYSSPELEPDNISALTYSN